MRVLHFAPRFLPIGPDAVIGGSNNGLWNLAVGLHQARPDIRQALVTATNELGARWMDGGLLDGFDSVFWRKLSYDRGPLVYGANVLSGLSRALFSAVRTERPDVLHGHSGYPHYAAVTTAVGALTGTPVIHSLYCPIAAEVNDRRRLLAHPALSWATLAGVRRILPMSDNVDRSLAAIGVGRRRRTVLRPGVRPSVWTGLPERDECRRRFGIQPDEVAVLFVGNPSRAKGIDLLLDAAEAVFPRHAGARLHCTFELSFKARAERERTMHERLTEGPLADRARFYGLLPNIRELMRAVDVAVFPFRNTSGPSDLPIALMECMAIGTPVVVSDLGGNLELVGPGGEAGAVFPAGDGSALARALEELLAAPSARRRELGATAAERVRTQFDLNACANLLASVYGDIVGGNH